MVTGMLPPPWNEREARELPAKSMVARWWLRKSHPMRMSIELGRGRVRRLATSGRVEGNVMEVPSSDDMEV
jgi:hypothetical protein